MNEVRKPESTWAGGVLELTEFLKALGLRYRDAPMGVDGVCTMVLAKVESIFEGQPK